MSYFNFLNELARTSAPLSPILLLLYIFKNNKVRIKYAR